MQFNILMNHLMTIHSELIHKTLNASLIHESFE